jgi:hypothetical protein
MNTYKPGEHIKPRRTRLDKLTNDKITKREKERRTIQEADDFAKVVMQWLT